MKTNKKLKEKVKPIPENLKSELVEYFLSLVDETISFYANKEYISFDYDAIDRGEESSHSDNDQGQKAKDTQDILKILHSLNSQNLSESDVHLIDCLVREDGENLSRKLKDFFYE